MRPTAIESLRAIGGAVNEALLPEVTSPFAEEAGQAINMMVESLAAEMDTAVEDLLRGNAALRGILQDALDRASGNDIAAIPVNDINQALAYPQPREMTVSALSAESDVLREALASLLEAIEDMQGEPAAEAMAESRAAAYRHLREEAVSGWSFFDVSGFRERIVQARAELESK
jgi:hypothetical protein